MSRVCAAVLVIAFLSGCDWEQASLLNGISHQPPVRPGHVVHVYLAVDGVSHPAAVEAQHRGAFGGFTLAKSIPMFPATSDASWSRILHTERFAGYEYTYYDHSQDKVHNAGVEGVVSHAAPHPHGSDDFPYYDAFDVHGSGYLDSVEKYAAPEQTFRAAVDQLFIVLAGRMSTQSAFTGYLLEMDVVGHDGDPSRVVQMLVELSQRIDRFKAEHPDTTLVFTLFSDHGIDGVRKAQGSFVNQAEVLEGVGVSPASSFADASARRLPLWAVAPEHTRVTYGTLNTAPQHIAAVAERVSSSPYVDLVVARAEAPVDAPSATQWVSLFLSGKEAVRFGFDAQTDTYWLPQTGAYAELEVAADIVRTQAWTAFTDERLFDATADRRYPDLFYRARTALLPVSIRNPADILYSLKETYALEGLSVPFAGEAGAGGSHGAMGGVGSQGILLTEEVAVAGTIRSENILTMFPNLQDHLARRGVAFVPGDPNAPLGTGRHSPAD